MRHLSSARVLLAAALSLSAALAQAQTTVTDAWIRGTVPGQQGTGMFAQITSAKGGKLVAVSSPAAKVVEIHEMAMEGGVMKMRAIAALDLPAGQAVALKPGGYHVMLINLNQTLKAGDSVPVTLVVEAADKKRESIELKVPVRTLAGKDNTKGHGGHGHKH